VSAALDMRVIERARVAALKVSGAVQPRGPRDPELVPDILDCVFDSRGDCFWVLYEDLSVELLKRGELHGIGQQQVCFWEVDEFRRGVEVVLDDATITSFSAEYPRYLHDARYRRHIDARHSPAREDTAQIVADNVKRLRAERGWSVTELARRAAMAPPNVHRVESAAHVPATSTLLRLARALEVTLSRLLHPRH
jgi:DNA-binding Xre family transcriptional regulator